MIVDICHLAKQLGEFFLLTLTTENLQWRGLTFHLPDEQPVLFDDVDPINVVVNKPFIHNTKFLAWMDANEKYEEAKNLTYSQFPLKFIWNDSERQ